MDPWYFLDIKFVDDPCDFVSEYPNGNWVVECPLIFNNKKYTKIVFDNENKKLSCFIDSDNSDCYFLKFVSEKS